MKKTTYLLIVGLAFLLSIPPATSQDKKAQEDFRFTVKTNPLAALGGPFWVVIVPVTGEYKVFFETVVTQKTSFQLGLSYLGPSVLLNLDELTSTDNNISGVKTSGFRIQGMYKFFLSRDLNAPEGFYVAPHLSYASASIVNKDNTAEKLKGTKLNVNGIFGYQLITSGGFTLDLFMGMGFVSRNWEVNGTDWDLGSFKNKSTVAIPYGFSFGYAF